MSGRLAHAYSPSGVWPSFMFTFTEQELSYRKQVARQLRRQYVEDRPKYYCNLEI